MGGWHRNQKASSCLFRRVTPGEGAAAAADLDMLLWVEGGSGVDLLVFCPAVEGVKCGLLRMKFVQTVSKKKDSTNERT